MSFNLNKTCVAVADIIAGKTSIPCTACQVPVTCEIKLCVAPFLPSLMPPSHYSRAQALVLSLNHHQTRYTIITDTALPHYDLRGFVVADIGPDGKERDMVYLVQEGKYWLIDNTATLLNAPPNVAHAGKITHLMYMHSEESALSGGGSTCR